jgi:hypothetical protein
MTAISFTIPPTIIQCPSDMRFVRFNITTNEAQVKSGKVKFLRTTKWKVSKIGTLGPILGYGVQEARSEAKKKANIEPRRHFSGNSNDPVQE